jgi:hypothetical protein
VPEINITFHPEVPNTQRFADIAQKFVLLTHEDYENLQRLSKTNSVA